MSDTVHLKIVYLNEGKLVTYERDYKLVEAHSIGYSYFYPVFSKVGTLRAYHLYLRDSETPYRTFNPDTMIIMKLDSSYMYSRDLATELEEGEIDFLICTPYEEPF